jgi:hypothetical protein
MVATMLLAAPVPDPGPPGPFGTMPWLRATVSRFANGETHARRRALVEDLLAELDPAELREAAAALSRADERIVLRAVADQGFARAPSAGAGPARAISPAPAAPTPRAAPQPVRAASPAPGVVELPYVPVAVLAAALGVPAPHVAEAVAATRVVAAAYHPHTSHPDADAALARLLELLPGDGDPEIVAARVAILVQACEATAGLVRGDDLPVPATRRVGPDGETVLVDLTGCPFGAGPRRCPGEAHARALADGVLG